jgi:hypothetical protein
MSIADKNKELLIKFHAKAKRVGCKFRNKDLRRLKYVGVNTFNDMLGVYFGYNVKLDEHGELVFSDKTIIEDMVPKHSLLDMLKPDPNWSNTYHQPVVMCTEHSLKYGDRES